MATTAVKISGHEQRLGDELVAAGYVTPSGLAEALEARTHSGSRSLRHILIEQKHLKEGDLVAYFAQRYRMTRVDLGATHLQQEAIQLVPYSLCTRFGLVPLSVDDDHLSVAISDPLAYVPAEQSLQQETGRRILLLLASEHDVQNALREHYKHENLGDQIEFVMGDETRPPDDAEAAADAAPAGEEPAGQESATSILDTIMAQAIMRRASDVHMEAGQHFVRIRFRIDGVMTDIISLPRTTLPALVGRVKVAAKMDISERRLPQDGAILMRASGRDIDLRVSTLPTIYGERVVMRILDKSGGPARLESIGLAPDVLDAFRKALDAPHGLTLVTGPTGSGKTTTLYAALGYLSRPGVNILTVEDPVEYKIEGISQVQTKSKIGFDFARALEAFLRQDPDVILVGEIRNEETAHVAVQASLTGHLVLSTLHMNSAAEALTRLIEMGVKQYVVGSTLRAVMAQRLIRRLCPNCRVPDSRHADLVARLGIPADAAFVGAGCPRCAYSGHMGRTSINELLVVNDEIRAAILGKATAHEVEQVALAHGMRTLALDAVRRVSLGETSIDDVMEYIQDLPGL